MIKAAILRSARSASRQPSRNFSAIARPALNSSATSSPRFVPLAFHISRCYSSAAGLAKPEIEGRIVDLLKNFDKVSCADAID
jgi:NADH dehydrogenase (ubiquinone) 1 alpha/beta subcomplex 1, acyl-carrier protein